MISLHSEIEMGSTGLLPALVSDYLSQNKSLAHLYKYSFDFSAFKQVIADKSNDSIDRKTLVEVLKKQYHLISASPSVTANIEKLASDKTFTITTAHQPSLLLSPLYFIYKISCVINIANQLTKTYPGYQFVPVFWMGSEDHDIDELNHAYVHGKKIEWNTDGRGAIGRIETESLHSVIEELKNTVSDSHLLSVIEKGVAEFNTFGNFTQYFINEIFKDEGLLVLDQDDATLKKIFARVAKDEIENKRAVEVLKPTIEFLESNYKVQAKPREINFFYLGENIRERIVFNSDSRKFEVINTSLAFTAEEMTREIESHPERFSPNVIFRPLFQEMILPNLAFVGGAGEMSYWLELKPLFDYYGINYPMQILRSSAAILNHSTEKKLEKLGLQAADFFEDIEQLINRYIQLHYASDSNLQDEEKKLEELFATIAAKAEAIDVTLGPSAASEKQKVLASIKNLEGKMLKAEKKKHETAVAQIRSIHAHLFPEGVLQERRENFIPYYDKLFIRHCVLNLNPFDRKFKFFSNRD
ncbi:MAG: bacillithiol biosynthesis cysteine-adding enzyme BshC [Bacteroidetes bacterium]|nr:bacillithiol biosynthesis cysteine-adding enzyme BshC [Bacteroidota bacterium]